jgi:hypothetical protein
VQAPLAEAGLSKTGSLSTFQYQLIVALTLAIAFAMPLLALALTRCVKYVGGVNRRTTKSPLSQDDPTLQQRTQQRCCARLHALRHIDLTAARFQNHADLETGEVNPKRTTLGGAITLAAIGLVFSLSAMLVVQASWAYVGLAVRQLVIGMRAINTHL